MKSTFILLLCIFGSAFAATDYTVDELTRLFLKGSGLTAEHLLKIEEDVPLEQDVRFFCSNQQKTEWVAVLLGGDLGPLDPAKPITLVSHGWIDNANRTWMKEGIADHHIYEDRNICAIDWRRLAMYEYSLSAKFTRKVGTYVCEFLNFLKSKGFDLTKATIVGHSLGGQIAGYAGKCLGAGILGQIIALDPAGPLFSYPIDLGPTQRLDKGDAIRVQVLHTAGGTLGMLKSCGHVDFFPNGGVSPQDGCFLDILAGGLPEPITCSHLRACAYWRYSLNPANEFFGYPCSNAINWKTGLCSFRQPNDRFGYLSTQSGKYYFDTTLKAPYAKGHA